MASEASDKVKVIYTPEGGTRREWVVDLDNPAWDLQFSTEKTTGWAWGEFLDRWDKSSAIAVRALIFALRKRDEPKLTIDAVMPTLGEIELEAIEDAKPKRAKKAAADEGAGEESGEA
jgi:hypothetical protein